MFPWDTTYDDTRIWLNITNLCGIYAQINISARGLYQWRWRALAVATQRFHSACFEHRIKVTHRNDVPLVSAQGHIKWMPCCHKSQKKDAWFDNPLEIHPKGSAPLRVAINRGVLQKTSKNEWVQVKQYPYKTVGLCASTRLFAAPRHFVGRYILPRCLIWIFFWVWVLLACLDPDPPKKASFCKNLLLCHFPAFSQLSLRSNPSFLQGNGLNDICGLSFFTMLTKSEAFIPTHFAQELFWKVKLTQQEISVRHSEPISLQKDGLLLKDNWGLSEENAGEWQSSRLLPNFAFFGHRVQAYKQG